MKLNQTNIDKVQEELISELDKAASEAITAIENLGAGLLVLEKERALKRANAAVKIIADLKLCHYRPAVVKKSRSAFNVVDEESDS